MHDLVRDGRRKDRMQQPVSIGGGVGARAVARTFGAPAAITNLYAVLASGKRQADVTA
jgi:hypothetical protein